MYIDNHHDHVILILIGDVVIVIIISLFFQFELIKKKLQLVNDVKTLKKKRLEEL